jgi:hypothetical protein
MQPWSASAQRPVRVDARVAIGEQNGLHPLHDLTVVVMGDEASETDGRAVDGRVCPGLDRFEQHLQHLVARDAVAVTDEGRARLIRGCNASFAVAVSSGRIVRKTSACCQRRSRASAGRPQKLWINRRSGCDEDPYLRSAACRVGRSSHRGIEHG